MKAMGLEEGIKLNGFHLSSIVGDSMMPLLRQGKDLVKIEAPPERLKKYDIALFVFGVVNFVDFYIRSVIYRIELEKIDENTECMINNNA